METDTNTISESVKEKPQPPVIDFENIENAFAGRSDKSILRAFWLFKMVGNNFLAKAGPPVVNAAIRLHLPIKALIKSTIFRHFCGGEDIAECGKTIDKLWENSVGSILDYSVEGSETETDFEKTCAEIIATVNRSQGDEKIPFCVFKITGIARFALLEKVSAGQPLNTSETEEFKRVTDRIDRICRRSHENDVRIFIDAEETWIQNAIDEAAEAMMQKYNREKPVVYNTIQLYRTDRFAFLQKCYEKAKSGNYFSGIKLVRGAYMEKERARAKKMNYPSPIQPDKKSCDRDFDESLRFCSERIERIALCAGTHNEESSKLLVQLMYEKNIKPDHPHVYFSQLLGMSDHISFNLSKAGYNVAKYVPYGPVESVLPYLFRRAAENTSISGQTSRELSLITMEKKRRGI